MTARQPNAQDEFDLIAATVAAAGEPPDGFQVFVDEDVVSLQHDNSGVTFTINGGKLRGYLSGFDSEGPKLHYIRWLADIDAKAGNLIAAALQAATSARANRLAGSIRALQGGQSDATQSATPKMSALWVEAIAGHSSYQDGSLGFQEMVNAFLARLQKDNAALVNMAYAPMWDAAADRPMYSVLITYHSVGQVSFSQAMSDIENAWDEEAAAVGMFEEVEDVTELEAFEQELMAESTEEQEGV